MIPISCPCGERYSVSDELAGKRVRCRECRAVLPVPVRGARSESVAAYAEEVPPGSKPGRRRKLIVVSGLAATLFVIGLIPLLEILWRTSEARRKPEPTAAAAEKAEDREAALREIEAALDRAEALRAKINRERIELLLLEKQRLDGVIAAEKERIREVEAAFGRFPPGEQNRAIALGNKAHRGEELSPGELFFLERFLGTEQVVSEQWARKINRVAYSFASGGKKIDAALKEGQAAAAAVEVEIEKLKKMTQRLKAGAN